MVGSTVLPTNERHIVKRKLLIGAACAALFLGACAETEASKADIDEPKVSGKVIPDDYEVRTPDKLNVYQNVDGHPSIVRVCIDGVAFRTLSTAHSQGGFNEAAQRVEEWDEYCES